MAIDEDSPHKIKDLHVMLDIYKGDIRRLFNTSGVDYRAMNLKDKLPTLKDSEALKLLSNNGNLIKRPFVIRGKEGAVGFSEVVWCDLFL